jgi:4'-phosphopantetheinyl transferase
MFLDRLHQEAHAWFVIPEAVHDTRTLDRFRSLLSSEELNQYRRFKFREDSHRYLVSHGLVREVLSRYVGIAPADWRFARTEHGRPEIVNRAIPAIRFNLTHTAGLAGCIITLADECGIDAEKITERHNPAGVAERMFSEAEYKALQRLKGREYLEYFFKRWTLREAYVKARGIGLSFPTRKLSFEIRDKAAINVIFQPDILDTGSHWQFQLLNLTDEHITAVAIARNGSPDRKLVTHRYEP